MSSCWTPASPGTPWSVQEELAEATEAVDAAKDEFEGVRDRAAELRDKAAERRERAQRAQEDAEADALTPDYDAHQAAATKSKAEALLEEAEEPDVEAARQEWDDAKEERAEVAARYVRQLAEAARAGGSRCRDPADQPVPLLAPYGSDGAGRRGVPLPRGCYTDWNLELGGQCRGHDEGRSTRFDPAGGDLSGPVEGLLETGGRRPGGVLLPSATSDDGLSRRCPPAPDPALILGPDSWDRPVVRLRSGNPCERG